MPRRGDRHSMGCIYASCFSRLGIQYFWKNVTLFLSFTCTFVCIQRVHSLQENSSSLPSLNIAELSQNASAELSRGPISRSLQWGFRRISRPTLILSLIFCIFEFFILRKTNIFELISYTSLISFISIWHIPIYRSYRCCLLLSVLYFRCCCCRTVVVLSIDWWCEEE